MYYFLLVIYKLLRIVFADRLFQSRRMLQDLTVARSQDMCNGGFSTKVGKIECKN